MKLVNKVAIVTGAASGIGRASAIMFAEEGAKIAVADLNDTGGEATANDIQAKGGEAIFVHTDVSIASDVENLIKATSNKFSKIDILFNVAGIPQRVTPIENVDEATWDKTYAVNVKSIFLTTKCVIPLMKAAGGGVIINLASMGGIRPKKYACAYTSSKGAAVYLTKTLALELAPDKIRVNCINPALTETPMTPYFFPEGEEEKYKQEFLTAMPLGRLVTTEEVAHAAVYLASDDAAMITGSCLNLDGGRGL